jgi:hypothetical protein
MPFQGGVLIHRSHGITRFDLHIFKKLKEKREECLDDTDIDIKIYIEIFML